MQTNDSLIETIDTLVKETFPATEPGATAIVVKDGKTIYRAGQGIANLELGVPVEPDMVFRVGSITKQFTAVAILMLAEEGKLALNDPITKFLPDYPTHDHLITVEHLLTHTSGIKSYTSMAEWMPLWRKDFSVQELIGFFKYQPMEFAPGKRWSYNNSAYCLLGAIIEKVSGLIYEGFLQQRIFDCLGMKQTYYDSPARIIPRRAAGYDKGPDGYANAEYLSMTQPYAAGALGSTVDDLARWDAALYTEQLLKQETLQRAFVSYRLLDGTVTDYGYGWALSNYAGHRLVEHGGGIHGFRTFMIRMPEDRVMVAVLSNNGGKSPELPAFKIATLAIGQPYREPERVELTEEEFAQYEGSYQMNASAEWSITREESHLYAQFGQNPRTELVPFSPNKFFFEDNSLFHTTFVRDENGRVTALEMNGRSGIPDIARKVLKTVSVTT